jgi:Protein of unknown function (DUF1326)
VKILLADPEPSTHGGGIITISVLSSFRERMEVVMAEIPSWHIKGDWFDNCSCAVACPCTFAQAPDNGFCESVLFWHIRRGHYGDINLDDLSFLRVGRWEGAPDLGHWGAEITGKVNLGEGVDRANEPAG